MTRKHADIRPKAEKLLDGAIEQRRAVPSLFNISVQIRAADARKEQGVTGEERLAADQIAGTLHCVTRCTNHFDGYWAEFNYVSALQCSVGKAHAILRRKEQLRAEGLGQFF